MRIRPVSRVDTARAERVRAAAGNLAHPMNLLRDDPVVSPKPQWPFCVMRHFDSARDERARGEKN